MDTTPAGLFDSYDADFQSILDSVKQKLDVNVKNEVGGMRVPSEFESARVAYDVDPLQNNGKQPFARLRRR